MKKLWGILLLCTWIIVLIVSHVFTPAIASVSFTGLGDLEGGDFFSNALGISADGSTVVGVSKTSTGLAAFRWSETTGIQALSGIPENTAVSGATAVSADGSVIVGYMMRDLRLPGDNSTQAFRWTSEGFETLPEVNNARSSSTAHGVSLDGNLVLGEISVEIEDNSQTLAILWYPDSDEIQSLPRDMDRCQIITGKLLCLPYIAKAISSDKNIVVGRGSLAPYFWELANETAMQLGNDVGDAVDVSADGSVVVGTIGSEEGSQGFWWKQGQGMTLLGDFPGEIFLSEATAVSADGSIVVGAGNTDLGTEAFIWSQENGLQLLKDVLAEAYQVSPTGWQLSAATGISADGLTITGTGINPSGQTEAWIVRLGSREPNS